MKSASLLTAILIMALAANSAAQSPQAFQPGKKEKCPVCGMFVYKYPDWIAQMVFKDGSAFFFDGAKDLFKYYFNLNKYNPAGNPSDISSVRVTEYYDMQALDGKTAFFVIGSDVLGPMGNELIPFKSHAAAEEFKKDHGGTKILTFEQVTQAIVEHLD